MKRIILIIIALVLGANRGQTKALSIPVSFYEEFPYSVIQGTLGSPSYVSFFTIDLTHECSLVVIPNSKPAKHSKSPLEVTKDPPGVKAKDLLKIQKCSIAYFPFAFIVDEKILGNPFFGNGETSFLNFANSKKSYASLLRENGFISKSVFKITEDEIIFGEEILKERSERFFKVPVVKEENKWTFKVKKMAIGNNFIFWMVNEVGYFDTSVEGILAPYGEEDFIIRHMKLRNKCEKVRKNSSIFLFLCDEEEVHSLPKFELQLDGVSLVYSGEELYKKTAFSKDRYQLVIGFKMGLKNWVFGREVIFDTGVVFDQEEGCLHFDVVKMQEKKNQARSKKGKSSYLMRCLIFTNIVLLIIMMGLFINFLRKFGSVKI